MIATAVAWRTRPGKRQEDRRFGSGFFDLILCSDSEILDQVRSLGQGSARVELMLDYHPELSGENVPDPYYGGGDGFIHVFDLLDESVRGSSTGFAGAADVGSIDHQASHGSNRRWASD